MINLITQTKNKEQKGEKNEVLRNLTISDPEWHKSVCGDERGEDSDQVWGDEGHIPTCGPAGGMMGQSWGGTSGSSIF